MESSDSDTDAHRVAVGVVGFRKRSALLLRRPLEALELEPSLCRRHDPGGRFVIVSGTI